MQNYHKHTYWSNPSTPDSAASYEDYAKRAVQLGHRVLSSVEHGWQGYYYEVFELAQKYNLKFIFGAEAYWVKDRLEKDKSNNHIVILAKNEKGRRAINAALSTANEDGYYFKPRLDIELLLSLPPDDVFVTTACVAFWKYDDSVEIVKQLHDHFKDNFMLEIQYHNTPEQISLNAKIKELSQQLGIEMIVGLDSHYIYPEQAQEREYVLEAKKLKYPDEDGWYMDYPSDEEIMNRFLVQNVFSQEEIQRAMDNTDITLSFDDIVFDKEIKLPTLYKDKTQEEKNKIFSRLITKLFKEYTSGMPKEMYDMYYEGVKKEVDVYKETGMVDYPLIDYEIVQEALRNGGMITPTGRGCFTKDALVHTIDGIKPLCDVKIGDYVIDMNGEFKKVLDTMSYHVDEDLIKITHMYGDIKAHPNICTLDHKILIHRNGETSWVQAKDIREGDYVCLPKMNLPETLESVIDLNQYNDFGYEYDDEYIYEYSPFSIKDYSYSPRELSRKFGVSKKLIEDFANGKKDYFRRKPEILEKIFNYIPFRTANEYRNYVRSMRTKRIRRYIKLDYEFGQFIGMMYGDGCNPIEKDEITLAINTVSHKNYINRTIFENIALRFGLKITSNKSSKRNLEQLCIRSKIVSNFISKFMFVSILGQEKQFNPELFNASSEVKSGILNGFILSDGSCAEGRKGFDNTSASIIGAFKVLSMASEDGILGICIREGGCDYRGYSRKKSFKLRYASNPFNCGKTKERCLQDEKYWYLPIKKTEILNSQSTTVYDLTVEGSHSYLINNMIVHNSGVGYFTNTLLKFSRVDRFTSPVKLYPERFISKTRILETRSLPDLDMNLGNPEVFEAAQVKVLGADHAVPMIAFGTFKKKSAFKLYARAKNLDFSIANEISKQIEKYDEAVKYADDDEKDQIDIYNFVDPQYHTYIKESVPYWGIVSDKKKAPCAFLLYDGSIREEIGLIRCKSESTKKDYIVAAIDGAIAEKYKFLKNDLLKVDVVLLINKIFNRIGRPLMSVNELMLECDGNQKVWDIYGKGLTIGVNQCEKPQAIKKLLRYKPQNVSELAAFIAAIRPAFKSMYSKFESREPFSYGIPAFDRLLQTPQFPQSFILYQEQTMTVLNYAGFPMDECYGIIKAIAKKHPEKVRPLKSRFIEGFKQKLIEEGVEPDEASNKSADVWQIISDSCGYGFNSAHAMCMALDSMYCAYLKSHYPFEFYEVMLQTYSEKGNKDKVAELKKEMSAGFNIIEGDYSWGKDNRKFVADPSTNSILPSLLSIKGMSQKAANDLYEAARMNPNITNFYDCWKLLQTVKSLDRAKIDTLVSINYFKCFGGAKKIRKFMIYIDALYGRSQFSKTDVAPALYGVIEKYSETTEKLKTFRNFNYDSALYELWDSLADEDFSIPEKLRNEIYVFDYVKSIIPDLPRNIYAVTDIDDKFKNRKVTLYRVCDGNSGVVKIRAKTFDDTPLEVGSVIRVDEFSKEKRWIKTSNGFEQIEDYETILKRYTPIIE